MGSAASKPTNPRVAIKDPVAVGPVDTVNAAGRSVQPSDETAATPADPSTLSPLSPRESAAPQGSVQEMARFESIPLEALTLQTPRKSCRKEDSGLRDGPHVSFTGAVVLVDEVCDDESLRSPIASIRPLAIAGASLGCDSMSTASSSFDSVVVGLTSANTKHRHQLAMPVRAEEVWKYKAN